MIQHLASLEKLIHELSKLPGIGPKTAQRLAYFILKSPDHYVKELSQSLTILKQEIRECPQCYSYTEGEGFCFVCQDPKRSDEILCVVEDAADIVRIDSSGAFRGRYHVLQGAISPLDGISPQDLKIAPLIDRVKKSQQGLQPIKEVVFALDADLEGDTTIVYIAKILQQMGVKISRIAQGVPIGGDIDYVDQRTLGRAIENRVTL